MRDSCDLGFISISDPYRLLELGKRDGSILFYSHLIASKKDLLCPWAAVPKIRSAVELGILVYVMTDSHRLFYVYKLS